MYDLRICPYCGGIIMINMVWDEGSCDTCNATYYQGTLSPPEDEDE